MEITSDLSENISDVTKSEGNNFSKCFTKKKLNHRFVQVHEIPVYGPVISKQPGPKGSSMQLLQSRTARGINVIANSLELTLDGNRS